MSNTAEKHRSVIVPASAGSGKTFRIAHEYIYDVLRDRYDDEGRPYFDHSFYKRILAVTFTNKATEEMKSRILNEIHLLASGQKSAHLDDLIKETSLDEATLRKRAKKVRSLILHDYSHFTVLTNDTFFQRILRAFVRELGVDISFSTELDTAPVLEKSIDALIEGITKDDKLRKWLEALVEERINEGKGWNIRNALASITGEIFNEATKDIIANSANREELKREIDNFAATVKKRVEPFKAMGQKALDAIKARGYIHSDFSSSFTNIFEKVAKNELTEFGARAIQHLADEPEKWFKKGFATPDKIELAKELQILLRDIYEEFIPLSTLQNTLQILLRNYRIFAILGDLQVKVDKVCSEENSRLLAETKHTIASFISESDTPFIYEKVGCYFDKFMIDEFQDTSAKEWNNFLPLLRNAISQSEDTSVLIVGDVKQSIYRWRGGDWSILGSEVEKQLPDTKSVPLENNWRSLPNIVKFNNSFYRKLIEYENNLLNSKLDEADRANLISAECKAELYDTLKLAYRDVEQKEKLQPTNEGYITITAPAEGVKPDAELVGKNGFPLYIERIKEVLERGFRPRDITILVRKNENGRLIANELLRYRNQFPKELWFDITTEEALSLASSPAVKLIIAIMRLSINRDDITSLMLYNYLHHHTLANVPLSESDNRFLDTIRTMSPEEAFERISIEYADDLEGQTAYVLALHEHISNFSNGKAEDIALFEQWWRDNSSKLSIRVERNDQTIEIMTIHKAKGLENKVIIIPLCTWELEPRNLQTTWAKPAPTHAGLSNIGKFPVSFSKAMANSLFADGYYREVVYTAVETLNMLYVATTRAKEQLHIFLPNVEKRGWKTNWMILDNYAQEMTLVKGTNYRQLEVGTFDGPEPKRNNEESAGNQIITEHSASPTLLKLRTSMSRYFEEENSKLSPRSMGIKLHRIFEGALTREDIFASLDEMVVNGELSREEAVSLRDNITSTLDNTIAGEWFDGSWERLHRERNIIRPNSTSKRPDRVMTRQREAVVIDYKFGEESNSYKKQIREYIAELKSMGYTSIKGYIWYVSAGKIVEIDQ